MVANLNRHHRRAFTVVPLALVLWILLVVLGVALWKKVPPPGYVPAKGVGPGQIGSIILAVLYGGFWFFSLGKVAEKKGQGFANIAAAITLGLAGVMMGLSYAGLTADQRNLAKAGGAAVRAPNASSPSTNPTASGPQRVPDQTQRQADRAKAPPTRPEIPAPVPAASTPPATPSAPESSVPPPPRPSTAPAQPTPTEHPGIEAAKKELLTSLDADADALIKQLRAMAELAAKPFRRDMRDMDQRKTDAGALKNAATTLAKRLTEIEDEIAGKLQSAGVPESEMMGAKIRIQMALRTGPRGMACDSLARFADLVTEQSEFWRANFNNWSVDGRGQVKWKQMGLEGKARSFEFRVEGELRQREMLEQWLKGQ